MISEPRKSGWISVGTIVLLIAMGIGVANLTVAMLPLGLVILVLAVVVMASRIVDPLTVAMFWALPYMIINLPTGSFTLKLSEATAYFFAIAALARAVIRKEKWQQPPVSVGVYTFLGVALLSMAFEPSVSIPFVGTAGPTNRNSADLRSLSEILWMSISWLVVIAAYNVIKRKPSLFPKCVAAHCIGGGIASLVSLALFVLFFFGFNLLTSSGSGKASVDFGGGFPRLAGVAYEPMFLGVYLISVIPITLVVYLLRPAWAPRRLTGLALILEIVTMFLSFSAGGFAGLTTAFIIIFICLRKTPKPPQQLRNLKIGVVVLLVIVCGVAIGVSGVMTKLASIGSKLTDTSGSNRHDEIVIGLREFEDYPLLGVGPGMTTFHFPNYSENLQSQVLAGTFDVHNIVLSTLGELGVIGFLALCFATFQGLRMFAASIARHGPDKQVVLIALTGSLVGCAIQALSLDLGLLSLMYFTGLLALSVSAYGVEHEVPAT